MSFGGISCEAHIGIPDRCMKRQRKLGLRGYMDWSQAEPGKSAPHTADVQLLVFRGFHLPCTQARQYRESSALTQEALAADMGRVTLVRQGNGNRKTVPQVQPRTRWPMPGAWTPLICWSSRSSCPGSQWERPICEFLSYSIVFATEQRF